MEGTAVKKWHKRKNTAAEGYDGIHSRSRRNFHVNIFVKSF
jgi:hypothetical protein